MSQQHTPAPWTADGYHNEYYASISVKAGGRGVCAISSAIKRPGAESAANARLIAAAPDLLAALEELLPAAARSIQGTTDGEPILQAARAALAKATGDKP